MRLKWDWRRWLANIVHLFKGSLHICNNTIWGMVESLHNGCNTGCCLLATPMHCVRCNFILAGMPCISLGQDPQVARHLVLTGLTVLSKYCQMLSCFLPQLDMMRETRLQYTMQSQEIIKHVKKCNKVINSTTPFLFWIEYS